MLLTRVKINLSDALNEPQEGIAKNSVAVVNAERMRSVPDRSVQKG